MSPGLFCHLDPRGGERIGSGVLDKDDIRLQHTCTLHTAARVCSASGFLATPFCELTRTAAYLNHTRWLPIPGMSFNDEQFTIRYWHHGLPPAETDEPVVAAAGDEEERYRAVAVGTDGKLAYNLFCSLHTTPAPPQPADPDADDDGGDPGSGSEDGDTSNTGDDQGETPALPPDPIDIPSPDHGG
jgi:hypothetical protein